ncbi:MAG TPA: rRNA maturation RNase YbeY [Candidatus Paceibacterota bacterium]
MANLSFSNFPKHQPSLRAFLLSAKDAALGSSYELSVAFVSPREMRGLNATYRGVDAPTDILSVTLSDESGEILFCVSEVARRAPQFQHTPQMYLRLLVIHGLLHLKGYAHGRRMEAQERKFRKKFKI